jgi:Protein of unknown function (DUF2000)
MKVVIVLDKNLPTGLLTNAAAVLAFSAAHRLPGGVGRDLEDADGGIHPGITNLPIPILACDGGQLGDLRAKALSLPGMGCVDFSDVAQRSKRYEEYAAFLMASKGSELKYLGLCLYGEASSVKRLTGHFALVK